jgi:hypothetical protein
MRSDQNQPCRMLNGDDRRSRSRSSLDFCILCSEVGEVAGAFSEPQRGERATCLQLLVVNEVAAAHAHPPPFLSNEQQGSMYVWNDVVG